MWSRRGRNLLWIYLIITLFVGMSIVPMTASASTAKLAASVIQDTTLTPDSTFRINVTIANVEKMWSYLFFIYYNTTILTATDYGSYDPFTEEAPSEINDTAGYVSVCYTMPFGEEAGAGFATFDPAPIAWIEFKVDGVGESVLKLKKTSVTDVDAVWIDHELHDGYFANVEVPTHDIAVTSVTASPTSVLVGENVTITATIEDQGDFDETFTVRVYYDNSLIEKRIGVTLSAGANTTLTFIWNTELVSKGKYTIKVAASEAPNEKDTADNTLTFSTVTVGGKGGAQYFLYIAVAAIAIIIVVAISAIYFLKIRKR